MPRLGLLQNSIITIIGAQSFKFMVMEFKMDYFASAW